MWLWLREHGHDPEDLSRAAVECFCDVELAAFLRTRNGRLYERAERGVAA